MHFVFWLYNSLFWSNKQRVFCTNTFYKFFKMVSELYGAWYKKRRSNNLLVRSKVWEFKVRSYPPKFLTSMVNTMTIGVN